MKSSMLKETWSCHKLHGSGTCRYRATYLTGQVLLHHKTLMYPTHIIMHKTCFISRIFFSALPCASSAEPVTSSVLWPCYTVSFALNHNSSTTIGRDPCTPHLRLQDSSASIGLSPAVGAMLSPPISLFLSQAAHNAISDMIHK